MNVALALKAALLGFIEGLTEFLPVSSTGHLILVGHYLKFESPGHSFEVLIQLGAILAILSVYFARLWGLAKGVFTDHQARVFVLGVLIAFLPAALIGAVMHSTIKNMLFNPFVVCISLIAGGLVLLVVDEMRLSVQHEDVSTFTPMIGCLDLHAHDVPEDRALPVPCDDSRRLALGCHDCRRDAVRRFQARCGRILVLPRHAHHGRGLHL